MKAQTNHHKHISRHNYREYRNSDLKPSNSIQVLVSLLINYQKLAHQLHVFHFIKSKKGNKNNQTKEPYRFRAAEGQDAQYKTNLVHLRKNNPCHLIHLKIHLITKNQGKKTFKNRLSESKDYRLATYLISAYLYLMKASIFLHI